MTYGTRLSIVIALLLLFSTSGLSWFFLSNYRKETLNSVYQSEENSLLLIAERLRNVIDLASVTEIQRVENSQDLILLIEDPCVTQPAPQTVRSKIFSPFWEELHINPEIFANQLSTALACRALETKSIVFLPNQIRFLLPYVTVMIRNAGKTRLALIPVDLHVSRIDSLIFITSREKKLLWSYDEPDFLQQAFADTLFTQELRDQLPERVKDSKAPEHWDFSIDGTVTSVAVKDDFLIHSLAFRPDITEAVDFATQQTFLFVAGFLSICFLLGRSFSRLLNRPLLELQQMSERVSTGDFSVKMDDSGRDEIAEVRRGFNTMVRKIDGLLRDQLKKAELEAELQLANQVQTLLIPPKKIETSDFRIASHFQTAAHCGGDWWGYYDLKSMGHPESDLVLMIGDATGHGVAPSMISALVAGAAKAIVSEFGRKHLPIQPEEILSELNRLVYASSKGTITMTFVVIVFDRGKNEARFANAAHLQPFLISRGENKSVTVQMLQRANPVIGADPNSEYVAGRPFAWNKGDRIFVCSDGLTDCLIEEKNVFDKKDVRKILQSSGVDSCESTLKKILAARKKVFSPQHEPDDITVVICEALT